ncbi:MAG: hypothetical protein LCH58_10565 [Bacteroidetes bacterium]|uniref:hypothetical protein n=1 Tax=Phnomibacter sp. TaxID=2836217 RepID=UPI002FDCE13E|nr:hypothetical protein [Bacteroidota bacterium]
MQHLFLLLLAAVCYCCPTQSFAQKNLQPASSSTVAGISLPANTKSDKRLLIRVAAKTTMDLEAADSNWILSDNYEVFQLPVGSNNDISDSIITALEHNGWQLLINERNNKWGLASKGSRRLMIYFETAKKESWLYIAEIAKGQAAKPAAPTSPTKPQPVQPAHPVQPVQLAAPANAGMYQFHTTNFDDGWTATVQADWVEVSKGNIKVLLHFSNAAIDMSSMQTPTINANAWNTLVAPRYKDKQNFYAFNGNMSYLRSSGISATLTDVKGIKYFVVLFRRGGGPFLEFITPDPATFEKEFGVSFVASNDQMLINSYDDLWLKMDNMQRCNKFAVAPADLIGNWSESSGSYAQMYNVNTGNYAGMNAVSNSAEFWIAADGSYRSQHSGASGMVGSQTFFTQKYNGRYTMNGNWEVSFTNRYNGKTDTYWCQFEIIRGGRILHLQDKTASGLQYHLTRK